MKSPSQAVREVCVRALYRLGKGGLAPEAWSPLRAALVDVAEDWRVRYWAVDGLVGLRQELSEAQRRELSGDLLTLLASGAPVAVQLHAAWGLGHLAGRMATSEADVARGKLAGLFREYGDGCGRTDAAFGWRVVGNALLQFGPPGLDLLETMRQQPADRWLAWIAYEVVHAPQRSAAMSLVSESEAVAAHDRYAPLFPGVRPW
ncbi:MAG: hypothetical protein FJ272_11055 [Planctomycetes bacterium]|nr:hypothetical protein [Planctomycetota bacterium]